MALPKFLQSSVDSTKLALTVQGILLGIIPLLLFLATLFGVTLIQGELSNVAGAFSELIIAVGGAVSAFLTLYGLVRKIVVKFSDKNKNENEDE